MSKIITKNSDNTVSITFASPHWEGTMEELAKKVVPTGLTYKVVEDSVIPTDKTFRNAWEYSDGTISVNITKAKNLWKEKIRGARKSKLEALDVDFMKAQETGADTSAIVSKKKELRDYPAKVDSATTTDEIKAVWDTDKLGDK
jgi:SRSO17 transposase